MNWIPATFLVASFAMTSFFWLRGIWRNRKSDCAFGLLLLGFSCLAALALDLLNLVGGCIMALGAVTMLVGRVKKRMSSNELASWGILGFLFFLFGLFLALLL